MIKSATTPRKRGRPRKVVQPAQPSQIPRLLTRDDLSVVLNCSPGKTRDLEANDPDFPPPIFIGIKPLWLEPEIVGYLGHKAEARARERAAEAETA